MDWRDVLKQFYKDTFHLQHWAMREKSLDYREGMKDSQWLSAERMKEWQHEKLVLSPLTIDLRFLLGWRNSKPIILEFPCHPKEDFERVDDFTGV